MIGKPPLAMLPRAVQGPMPLAAGGAAARVRIERSGEGPFCGSHLAANMRSRGVRSPDEWDAVALTFAEPVSPPSEKILIRIPLRRPLDEPVATKGQFFLLVSARNAFENSLHPCIAERLFLRASSRNLDRRPHFFWLFVELSG